MSFLYTPQVASYPKVSAGQSNVTCVNNVYKFMGCSIVSVNMSIGFNGTPSSATVTLVEDLANGDGFVQPVIPSLWGLSFPKGGVGAPIFIPNGTSLSQLNFNGTNVPFYFCGLCTSWSIDIRNPSGKLITVNLTDPREVLSGVQCLLSGFALSQNIGNGFNRYSNVRNVIDVFGHFNYGYETDSNEFGMTWTQIKQCLNSVGVRLFNIDFEFHFTGNCFNTPSWYRVNEQVIDLIGLLTKVCEDGGSDLLAITRKAASNVAIVEFRAIQRNNMDPLFQSEVLSFVNQRTSIVETARMGREFRNQPDSSVIIGGMRNSNYVAWPSQYDEDMHLNNDDKEDYNLFPDDIKVRLFGGGAEIAHSDPDGSDIFFTDETFTLNSGAIYPFWGFTPDDHAYPLLEPFLPLDHLIFDAFSTFIGDIKSRIPLCLISIGNFSVRNVTHSQVFLDGDDDDDERPFAYLQEYRIQQSDLPGWIRGLPLNTEVLRAALQGKRAFFTIYPIYYPDIASAMGIGYPNFISFRKIIEQVLSTTTGNLNIEDYDPIGIFHDELLFVDDFIEDIANNVDSRGRILKTNPNITVLDVELKAGKALRKFWDMIYHLVRDYADQNMGKRWMVCLPHSEIMERIWNNLPVPTRPERPDIEYTIADRGYWEVVPDEFDGFRTNGSSEVTGDPEDQIRRKFMAEDGRFGPMVIMDRYPTGNINFNSNGQVAALFQDLEPSSFRPSKIATYNPEFVCIECNVNQLSKRPDLALVEIPGRGVQFDPTNDPARLNDVEEQLLDHEFIIKAGGIYKYIWRFLRSDNNFRSAVKSIATRNGTSFTSEMTKLAKSWSQKLYQQYGENWFQMTDQTEYVMDLKAVIIPLNSTWMAYGPWYAEYSDVQGMVNIEIDESLVPWNFERPDPESDWDLNLNIAGEERLSRSIAQLDYLDTATIVVAGFPELGPGDQFGFNSNLTSLSVDFGIAGVRTTYSLAAFDARPGTYRKSDYDELGRIRIDTRSKLPDPINTNLFYINDGRNMFKN